MSNQLTLFSIIKSICEQKQIPLPSRKKRSDIGHLLRSETSITPIGKIKTFEEDGFPFLTNVFDESDMEKIVLFVEPLLRFKTRKIIKKSPQPRYSYQVKKQNKG